ncbi:MAG: ECF-family polymerase sigma factor [Labilithrix sp.]|jgi:RNA polymerase sigma-70 factor (ECF subfamily)|nr:ECF-family polymerase sigma factor [Labilithrix sp.]
MAGREHQLERPIEAEPPSPLASESLQRARAASCGDTRAMRDLLCEVGPCIERVVRAILGRGHQDVEDVVQQSMLGLVQALPSFRGECEPVFFASRVAARTAIAAAKRARALRARHDDGVDVDLVVSPSAPAPLADTERGWRMTLVRDALACIPSEQAETLALRIVLGWTLGEVADATGVPLNTVRSRLRLAKAALRSAITFEELTGAG